MDTAPTPDDPSDPQPVPLPRRSPPPDYGGGISFDQYQRALAHAEGVSDFTRDPKVTEVAPEHFARVDAILADLDFGDVAAEKPVTEFIRAAAVQGAPTIETEAPAPIEHQAAEPASPIETSVADPAPDQTAPTIEAECAPAPAEPAWLEPLRKSKRKYMPHVDSIDTSIKPGDNPDVTVDDKRRTYNAIKKCGKTLADLPPDFWHPRKPLRFDRLRQLKDEWKAQEYDALPPGEKQRLADEYKADLLARGLPENFDHLGYEGRQNALSRARMRKLRAKNPTKRRGRPPINGIAMTPAEQKARKRAEGRAAAEAAVAEAAAAAAKQTKAQEIEERTKLNPYFGLY